MGTNDEEEILTGYLGPKSNVNTPKYIGQLLLHQLLVGKGPVML